MYLTSRPPLKKPRWTRRVKALLERTHPHLRRLRPKSSATRARALRGGRRRSGARSFRKSTRSRRLYLPPALLLRARRVAASLLTHSAAHGRRARGFESSGREELSSRHG